MLKYLVRPPQKRRKIEAKTPSNEEPSSQGQPRRRGHATRLVESDDASDGGVTAAVRDIPEAAQSALDLTLPAPQDDTPDRQTEGDDSPAGDDAEDNQRLSPRERIARRFWRKGQSSIYVDAFDMTLDEVLESEQYLFDEPELALFDQWRTLSYGARFLYVRLFLRKTAAWHRVGQLAYSNDVSDMSEAIEELRKPHLLPGTTAEVYEPIACSDVQSPAVLQEHCQFAEGVADLGSLEEALSLLVLPELKTLAKEEKATGKTKDELVRALARGATQGRLAFGATPATVDASSTQSTNSSTSHATAVEDRQARLLARVLAITGDCVRLSEPVFRLFERVHLIFYRSTEWTEKSLSTIILTKMSKRNFPSYTVSRSHRIFDSRASVLEFESAMRLQNEVDNLLEYNKDPPEKRYGRVKAIAEAVYPRWKILLARKQARDSSSLSGEIFYLRRFSPAWVYSRILHKGLQAFARFKEHRREYDLLCELLVQRVFHPARRGAWYQRKALLEEHYAWELFPRGQRSDDAQKKEWKRTALQTAEAGLQDPQTHVIYHYDLQKRIMKLEKALRVVKGEQHDFGHVMLAKPLERTVAGIQVKSGSPSGGGNSPQRKGRPTVWIDEREGGHCRVETMCLRWYESQGWKGFHTESGIIRTLFAYLFYDILFSAVPGVFQTEYQTCPLDLHTDSFYPARMSEINHRLVEISNGEARRYIEAVHAAEYERRTCIVGLDWSYELADLQEIAECFPGEALATVCKVLAQDYQQRGGGLPDLFLWHTERGIVLFSEVKSENDRLSDTQRLWMHILTSSGAAVELCHAVAKETRVENQQYDWQAVFGKAG